jgi:hypothetical protein
MWPFSKRPEMPKANPPVYVVSEPRKIGDSVPVGQCVSMPRYGIAGEYWIAEEGKIIWTGETIKEYCAVVRAGAKALRK